MSKPTVKYLKDYTPSQYQINSTNLTFHLDETKTLVTAVIEFFNVDKKNDALRIKTKWA